MVQIEKSVVYKVEDRVFTDENSAQKFAKQLELDRKLDINILCNYDQSRKIEKLNNWPFLIIESQKHGTEYYVVTNPNAFMDVYFNILKYRVRDYYGDSYYEGKVFKEAEYIVENNLKAYAFGFLDERSQCGWEYELIEYETITILGDENE